MENTTRPTITTGKGKKNPNGKEVLLDPRAPAESLRAKLDELDGVEAWWAPHSYDGYHRKNEHWRRASFVALDIDYHDGTRTLDEKGKAQTDHAVVPGPLRERVEWMLRTLSLPDALERSDGQLRLGEGLVVAYPTPRGHRVVLTLRAPITDEGLYARAWAGAARLMTDELKAHGLLGVPNEAPGLCVDMGTGDPARMLWTPRATIPGEAKPRDARCTVYGAPGAMPFDAAALSACAPADTHVPRVEADEPAHARWADIRTAVSKGTARADADRVQVRCLFHADRNASAVVFETGRLWCSSCARSWRLDEWARHTGASELLGDELTRALTGGATDEDARRFEDTLCEFGEYESEDGDWLEEETPHREWLLTVPARKHYSSRPILPRGVVAMLAAGGGVGKTTALVQLAVAVATGRRWLACERGNADEDFPGFETPEGGGRVLLMLGEEDRLEVRRKLRMAAIQANLTKPERTMLKSRIVVPRDTVSQSLQLVAKADRWASEHLTAVALGIESKLMNSPHPWALVVLDPLAQFAGPETETDNAVATKFVQLLRRFTTAPGKPAVLVAHHNTKATRREGVMDDTGARGASALSDGVRWHAAMVAKEHPEGREGLKVPRMAEFRVVKTNYGMPLDETLWLARGEGGTLRAASKTEAEKFKAVAAAEAARRAAEAKGGAKTAKGTTTAAADADDFGYAK